MMDFPVPTFIGQVYNPGTGNIYTWDGVAWNLTPVQVKTARDKNLIVNPAMAISQENSNAAGNTSTYYPADQWPVFTTGPVISSQRVLSLTPDGNPNRIRKTVTTPKASLAAGDVCSIAQYMEGVRVVSLGYGTLAALQAVLRFGFKGPAGTYSVALRNDGTRSYIKNFTITAAQANVDTLQTFVIPGDVTGVWANDNSRGLILNVVDACGTTYQGVEGWQAGVLLGTSANSNFAATNGNVIELWDVGLYADPDQTGLAPPFVAPQWSDALIDCLRYYNLFSVPVQYLNGFAGTAMYVGYSYGTPMRVNPTGSTKTIPNGYSTSGGAVSLSTFQLTGLYLTAFSVTASYSAAFGGWAGGGVMVLNARM